MAIPNKVRDRLIVGLKRFLPVLVQQRARDVSEADTVTVIKDFLSEVLGYDKYAELTSEHAIRGTYCDLAVKIDEKLVQLIEVKAIGTTLDDRHVKQAIDYAANQGVEWVVLTNGISWRLYQVIFAKPIDKKLLIEFDVIKLDPKKEDDLDCLYMLSREGFAKGIHIEYRDRIEATSRFMIAALLLHNDAVIGTLRRELRRIVDVNVTEEEVLKVLHDEVIKRDVVEGAEAEGAIKRVNKGESRPLRAGKQLASKPDAESSVEVSPVVSSGENNVE